MKEQTQTDIRAHAVADYPHESCGLVVVINGKERYWPCRNIATTAMENFTVAPEDFIAAEDAGEVIAVVHSHPDVLPVPSEADKVMIEASQLAWHIVHVSGSPAVATDILTYHPNGYEAPLVGRGFTHGVLDCYSLIRDYYSRVLQIELPEFAGRRDNWWLNGENLYMDNFESAGFAPIKGAIQVGDVIIMQIRAPVANHAGVYIGDGMILHHVLGRLSSRDIYDGYWQENTRVIVRRQA